MATIPVIKVATADVKYASVSGKVTVGAESAARLTKKLGREVKAGDVFDLGVLAEYNRDWNWFQRLYHGIKMATKRHEFSSY